MEKIIKITAPDNFSITKSWTYNCNTVEELLNDFVSNHTFLVGYRFEIVKGS